jgi:hypothetical protein
MDQKNFTKTVPEHVDGKIINAERFRDLSDTNIAKAVYETARKRLLDVNKWNKISSGGLADFQLSDAHGAAVSGPVQQGLYFRVDIPGPGSDAGGGYDWVFVEKIEGYETEDVQSIAVRVRPSANPAGDDVRTAHFYTSEATSTFTVTREKLRVTAAVYDRNIKVNEDSDQVLDRARNMVVGTVGRMVFSRIQWEDLAAAWLE